MVRVLPRGGGAILLAPAGQSRGEDPGGASASRSAEEKRSVHVFGFLWSRCDPPCVLHVRKTNSRGQLSASHYHPSNPAWPASGESRVVGASMERELPTASWPTPLTPSPPSSACWLGKGAGTSRLCWMPIEGPAASCTLRTLFKTVPPLRKYWSCRGAKISELAISQISLCKCSLPPDRLTSVQAFVENVPSVGAHVLCSLLAASSRRGGRHGTLLS